MTQDPPDAIAYRRTADAFRVGDLDLVKTLVAPEVVWHVPGQHDMAGTIGGREALLTWLASSGTWASGSSSTMCSQATGMSARSARWAPAVTASSQTRVISIFRYRDGRQVERWFYPDDTAAWNTIFALSVGREDGSVIRELLTVDADRRGHGPWIVSAVAFATSMSATPGPNNAMLASSGSLWGFRRTIPHMLGIAIGFGFMLLAVAGGLGTLLLHHPTALEVMRWVAAVYLLWLAYRIATAAPAARDPDRRPGREGATVHLSSGCGVPVGQPEGVDHRAERSCHPDDGVERHLAPARRVARRDLRHRHLLQRGALDSLGVTAARFLRTPRALRGFNLLMAALLVASIAMALLGID